MKDGWSLNFVSEMVSAPRCTAVAAYTPGYIFQGDIHHAISERLLDVLNVGSVVDLPDLPQGFLVLTEVEIFSPENNRIASVPSCILNKSRILLIGEKRLDQIEPPPTPHYRSSLFTQKKPVPVNILISFLTVGGHVHIIEWQRAMSAVDTEQLFLPLTDARILSAHGPGETEFGFAAVNKSLIIAIMEAENA
jgi:hypothetical protein